MGIRAAHPERGHACPPRSSLPGPGSRLRQQTYVTRRPVHMRGRFIGMQRRRQLTVPHRHHHLDDPGHTRRRLRMPDVRLHRPQPQRTPLRPVLAVRGQQRLRLDRVAQRRPRAVSLHHVHFAAGQTGVGQGLPDDPLLGGAVGRRQTVRRTVLIHSRTTQHPEHPVTVATGVRQPLKEQYAGALGPPRAVRRLGEGLATAVGGQAALAAELHESGRGRHHRRATRQGQRALAGTQRLRGEMHRHQRRRTRRVHRHRRTLQPEHIRETARHHARRVPGQEVALAARVARQGQVVLTTGAHEHAGRAGTQ
ncbi:hypothetical protein Sgri01_05731 [Streptomyces griseus]